MSPVMSTELLKTTSSSSMDVSSSKNSTNSSSVDGQRHNKTHNVWSRELENGQDKIESARNEADLDSFRADAIPEN